MTSLCVPPGTDEGSSAAASCLLLKSSTLNNWRRCALSVARCCCSRSASTSSSMNASVSSAAAGAGADGTRAEAATVAAGAGTAGAGASVPADAAGGCGSASLGLSARCPAGDATGDGDEVGVSAAGPVSWCREAKGSSSATGDGGCCVSFDETTAAAGEAGEEGDGDGDRDASSSPVVIPRLAARSWSRWRRFSSRSRCLRSASPRAATSRSLASFCRRASASFLSSFRFAFSASRSRCLCGSGGGHEYGVFFIIILLIMLFFFVFFVPSFSSALEHCHCPF